MRIEFSTYSFQIGLRIPDAANEFKRTISTKIKTHDNTRPHQLVRSLKSATAILVPGLLGKHLPLS